MIFSTNINQEILPIVIKHDLEIAQVMWYKQGHLGYKPVKAKDP